MHFPSVSDFFLLQSIFLTKPLRSGILFLTSSIFEVTRPLTPGIPYQYFVLQILLICILLIYVDEISHIRNFLI